MSGQSAEAKRAICSANGSKSKGRKLSEEHRRKLSKPGEFNPFYGKTHTEETRQILREKALNREWTKDSRNKLSKTLKSRSDVTGPRRCKIADINYSSIIEASRKLDISVSLLRYRLNSLNWNQYIWIDPPSDNKRPHSCKRVLIGNKEYSSIAEAARILGFNPSIISKRCRSDEYTDYSFVINGQGP